MPTPFEAEIGALLRDLGTPAAVAEDLIRRWNLGLLSTEEQKDCAQFLVSAGLYSVFFRKIRALGSDRTQIPWAQLADAIGYSRVQPTDEEIEALFDGAKAQNSVSDLVLSHQLDIWSRRFSEARAEIAKIRSRELEARKAKIKDDLEFIRANRLMDEEEKILKEAEMLFPSDTDVLQERDAFKIRWARDVIARATFENDAPEASDLARRSERLTAEQTTAKALIVSRALEVATEHPSLAYDLAMSLHFMDFHTEALEVLSKAPLSAAVEWLKLDLLIAARLFVDAMTESTRLETVYAADPEATFTATYARARALKGLGQDQLAIDLMRSLVRVRPGYKSAQSFLLDWSGGDE